MADAPRRVVVVELAGKSFRVATSAGEQELIDAARRVDDKIAEVGKGRAISVDVLALTALALAHEGELQRVRANSVAADVRANVEGVIRRAKKVVLDDEADNSKEC